MEPNHTKIPSRGVYAWNFGLKIDLAFYKSDAVRKNEKQVIYKHGRNRSEQCFSCTDQKRPLQPGIELAIEGRE